MDYYLTMNKFNSYKNNKKIIDSFSFFNEFDLLKLRLNYLNDIVDYFLICECNHTYSAIPKPYYLDEVIDDIPENIRKKIIRIKYEIDGRYYYNDAWRLEKEQRNFISKNLDQFSPDDIIMVSDLDEIPKKKVVKNFLDNTINHDTVVGLKHQAFVYNFNIYLTDQWVGTSVATVDTCIKNGSEFMRGVFKYFDQNQRDEMEIVTDFIENAGWHFTYFGDVEKIKLKINSFAHQEVNNENLTNEIYLENCIKNKKLYYDESISCSDYDFNNYPEDLKKLIIKFFPEKFFRNFQNFPTDNTKFLYLNLLKKSVTDALYNHELLREDHLDGVCVTEDCLTTSKRSQSMIGLKRLDNIQECFDTVMKDNIPGDLIETGVWRGGSTIFMAGLIKIYEQKRKIFVADSFEGLPYPNIERFPDEEGDPHWMCDYMKISIDEVSNNFKAYDLLDENIIFVKGWFENTLPTLKNEIFSLIRLDGDMYGSTWDALENLYPRLSAGGYLIVDDWTLPGAHKAVVDYRNKHNITDTIVDINKYSVFWRKGK